MKANEAKVVREGVLETLVDVKFDNMEYRGRTSEGAVFEYGEGEFVVIRAVVKSEKFDLNDALDEYAEKVAKTRERELEKAKKAEKREAEKADKGE